MDFLDKLTGKTKTEVAPRKPDFGIKETVVEKALSIMEKNEKFIITIDKRPTYIGLLFKAENIGGLSVKDKKDVRKGAIFTAIESFDIEILSTAELIANYQFIIIPSEKSLSKISEYTLLFNSVYNIVFVNSNQTIDIKDWVVTIADINKVASGKITIEQLLAAFQTDIKDETTDDTIINETSVVQPIVQTATQSVVQPIAQTDTDNNGTEYDVTGNETLGLNQWNPEEPFFEGRYDDEPYDDEPLDENNYQAYDDAPDESDGDGENEINLYAMPPDDDSSNNNAAPDVTSNAVPNVIPNIVPNIVPVNDNVVVNDVGVGNVSGADTTDLETLMSGIIPDETVNTTIIARLTFDTLEITIDDSDFSAFIKPYQTVQGFEQQKGNSAYSVAVNQMIQNANNDLIRFHNNAFNGIREKYITNVAKVCDELRNMYSLTNTKCDTGKVYAKLQKKKQSLSDIIETEVNKRKKEIDDKFEQDVKEYGDAAYQKATAEYRSRHIEGHNNQIAQIRPEIERKYNQEFQQALLELNKSRKENAQTDLQRMLNSIHETLKSDCTKAIKDETALYNNYHTKIMQFCEMNKADEMVRIKVLQQEQESSDKVKAIKEEYESQIKTLTESYTKTVDDLNSRIAKLQFDSEQTINHNEETYAKKLEEEQKRIDKLLDQFASLDAKKEEEYEKRLKTMTDDKMSLDARFDNMTAAYKKANVVTIGLMTVSIIAAIAIGVIVGLGINIASKSDKNTSSSEFTESMMIEYVNSILAQRDTDIDNYESSSDESDDLYFDDKGNSYISSSRANYQYYYDDEEDSYESVRPYTGYHLLDDDDITSETNSYSSRTYSSNVSSSRTSSSNVSSSNTSSSVSSSRTYSSNVSSNNTSSNSTSSNKTASKS